ncbi:MAG: L-2-amino-thiazoline-4-carboxylic acid hydrolase [Alphaproteobacteria bacterium]|nr:L-2-amino-thiazoline-4-carboxylic acid hydrolase [Alphaproteobacteria bacterium]
MKIDDLPYKMGWADKLLIKKLHKYIADFDKYDNRKTAKIFAKIMAKNVGYITDEPSQTHMIACAYIMATYEQLRLNGDDQQQALDKLTWAFKQPGRLMVTWGMRLWLWLSRDIRGGIEHENIRKEKLYGQQFEFSAEIGESHYISVVSVCGYHEFFKRNSYPELTAIFCAWDVLWTDEIDKQNCGVRFERPCTLGMGGDCCRFEFYFDEIE